MHFSPIPGWIVGPNDMLSIRWFGFQRLHDGSKTFASWSCSFPLEKFDKALNNDGCVDLNLAYRSVTAPNPHAVSPNNRVVGWMPGDYKDGFVDKSAKERIATANVAMNCGQVVFPRADSYAAWQLFILENKHVYSPAQIIDEPQPGPRKPIPAMPAESNPRYSLPPFDPAVAWQATRIAAGNPLAHSAEKAKDKP